MLKHTFFAPPDAIAGDTIVLPSDEAYHAVRVLRLKTGDEAAVVDGEGRWYKVVVEVIGRKNLVGRILENNIDVGEPSYHLTIGLSLLKNMARYETFVEKAVEYGVSRIIPLVAKRSERSRMKSARLEKILIGAMKQSGRSRKIMLDPPVKMKKLSKLLGEQTSDFRGICHETSSSSAALRNYVNVADLPGRAIILVGPEGGFTADEVESLEGNGFRQLYLGQRRLRAESAALAVASAFLLAENSG